MRAVIWVFGFEATLSTSLSCDGANPPKIRNQRESSRGQPLDRIKINDRSSARLDVEILPNREERGLGGLVVVAALAITMYGTYEFGPLRLKTAMLLLPFWIMGLVFVLKGWNDWVWSSRGSERITIREGKLIYVRYGSFLDRKSKELDVNEITKVVILWIGLGDSGQPNRLQLKARHRSLLLGRNLSKADGQNLAEILRPFLPGV
jgi:hypothetical protein